jgi:hypothetical protein
MHVPCTSSSSCFRFMLIGSGFYPAQHTPRMNASTAPPDVRQRGGQVEMSCSQWGFASEDSEVFFWKIATGWTLVPRDFSVMASVASRALSSVFFCSLGILMVVIFYILYYLFYLKYVILFKIYIFNLTRMHPHALAWLELICERVEFRFRIHLYLFVWESLRFRIYID